MELNEYQRQAMTTCMDSSNNVSYMLFNLIGEVGEFASKVAKGIRKEVYAVNNNQLQLINSKNHNIESIREDELMKEAGDILWQLSGLCSVMGWTLDDVAKQNLEKLASRQQRGIIDGNGDNR
jgi:NTP pyrophosphatase (non-canonical NTP hydrolase)